MFLLLKKGHKSRYCTAKLVCSKCKHQHPTCLLDLDIWKLSRIESAKASSRVPDATETNMSMKVGTHPASSMTSMIVPVFLSTTTSEDSVLVYALLDTQSDSSFEARHHKMGHMSRFFYIEIHTYSYSRICHLQFKQINPTLCHSP